LEKKRENSGCHTHSGIKCRKNQEKEQGRLEDRRGSRSDLGPELSGLLGDRASDGRALHLTLGVDDDTSVVLKVDEGAVATTPGLALTDDDSGVHLLAELGLALLAGGEDHVSNTGLGETVQTTLVAVDSDDGEGLGTSVVSTVEAGGNGETARDLELGGHTDVLLGRHVCESLKRKKKGGEKKVRKKR